MKKKRIAFVVNGLYGGGAERVMQVFLSNFDRQKYDITLVNHKEEVVEEEFYPSYIEYKSILKGLECRNALGKLWVKIYNKINLFVYENFSPRVFRTIYLRDRYDVEIAFIEGYATRIVSGGRSDKKIAWVHIDLKLFPWTDIAFRSREEQKECYTKFDCVVSVSETAKRSVDELFECRRSVVIYNPIDGVAIKSQAAELKPERDEPFLFVSVGRLVDQKGYDRLIPIVGKLVAEGFDFRLWIVGEGSDRALLEGLIRERKLEGVVELLGYKNNPYPYIAAADWFVFSSRHEGYGLVVVESLMLGVPVISVMCAEMGKILGDNDEWGIVTENSEQALLDGMRDVLKNRELTTKYKSKALERGTQFSLEKQMDEIYAIIND